MNRPPPALDCAHVIEYAVTDEAVTFEQRHTLNVGGEWLGEVSNLAICQNFDETEFIVFHCNSEWEVLGVAAGYGSIQEAKERTERSYRGITSKWMASGYSREEAIKHVETQLKDQSCSFCGRTALQFEAVAGDVVRICNHCVDDFYEIMHDSKTKT
jgi:NADH pyrophosphatase NudC (nudix superfamily)